VAYSRSTPTTDTVDLVAHPLQNKTRPQFQDGPQHLRLVDLFAGCGGLTLGVAQAAQAANLGLAVPLALDVEQVASDVYKENFDFATVETGTVESYFDGELGDEPTIKERETLALCGEVHVLVGGPPCQGHSDLNNHTRREDPKNRLYARMARAAEVLDAPVVIIENVPAVQHDKGDVVGVTSAHLKTQGYKVAARTVALHALGVAQSRRRHVLIATRLVAFEPEDVLKALVEREPQEVATLRWAIGDLEDVEDPTGYDIPAKASKANLIRMQHLLDTDQYNLENEHRPLCHQDDHSYKSMYGRLWWDRPAQTITSGFGSIGQGRYMHPSRTRALTAHEAARIQGFPDYFSFAACTRRGDLAVMIGNAVPPALTREIVGAAVPALRAELLDRGQAGQDVALRVVEPAKQEVAVLVSSDGEDRAAGVEPGLSQEPERENDAPIRRDDQLVRR
jgi:DNA (cytosine-5)-methyltransferase 1